MSMRRRMLHVGAIEQLHEDDNSSSTVQCIKKTAFNRCVVRRPLPDPSQVLKVSSPVTSSMAIKNRGIRTGSAFLRGSCADSTSEHECYDFNRSYTSRSLHL